MSDPVVDKLFRWLAVYVAVLIVVAYVSGNMATILDTVTQIVTAVSTAAFALMKAGSGNKPTPNEEGEKQ